MRIEAFGSEEIYIMRQTDGNYYKKDFWIEENLNYAKPHFRLEKVARMINRIARGKELDLLDVGCGPAILMRLLQDNIKYYGIDIAIHNPATNLLETDFLQTPIKFGDKRFDIVLAQGVFEYVGSHQSQKFSEIRQLLKENGIFISSYVNFNHRHRFIYPPYNNVQSFDDFRKSLGRFFHITSVIPTSQRWYQKEPLTRFTKAIHMHMNVTIPFITRQFAVEYLFVCSPRTLERTETERSPASQYETALNK
jgi:SAM-dependent methyltransferase